MDGLGDKDYLKSNTSALAEDYISAYKVLRSLLLHSAAVDIHSL